MAKAHDSAVLVWDRNPAEDKFLLTEDNNALEEVFPSYFIEDFRIDTPGGFPDKGISIAICKKVILLHYGIIHVEKNDKDVTRVIFTIEKK